MVLSQVEVVTHRFMQDSAYQKTNVRRCAMIVSPLVTGFRLASCARASASIIFSCPHHVYCLIQFPACCSNSHFGPNIHLYCSPFNAAVIQYDGRPSSAETRTD